MSMIKSNYQIDVNDLIHLSSLNGILVDANNNYNRMHNNNITTNTGNIIVPTSSIAPILVSANCSSIGINSVTGNSNAISNGKTL
jgi:hypothetical protein